MFTMNDLFEIAIQMEKNGESVYTHAIQKIQNKELRSLVKWMAGEEALHGRWFLEQKNRLSLETDEAGLKQMVPQALQDMMGEKTLSLEDINFSTLTTAPELLEIFTGFEQDTILFYELLELLIEDEAVLAGLRKIILEEKNHLEKIRVMMDSLSEESI